MFELYSKSDALPAPSVNLEQALRIPFGVASPLWLFVGGAASAGVAYWWATQWLRPVNLEALLPAKADSLLSTPVGGEAAPFAGAAMLAAAEEVEQVAFTQTIDPLIDAPEVAPEPASFVSEPGLVVEIASEVALSPSAGDGGEPARGLPPAGGRRGRGPPATSEA